MVAGIKPGWVRINFNYFISEAVFTYLVEAVDLVSSHGWKLLPEYRFDTSTGRWNHRLGPIEPPVRLSHLHYDPTGVLIYPRHKDTAPETALLDYLKEARSTFESLSDSPQWEDATLLSSDFEHLRWFDLPAVCLSTTS